ncbi:NADPH-dependent FMN reductase [Methylibium petroleiphilum]|uniref:Putative NADPH-dependent fmn reductase oxidoreductase protein n=1 Tax=Methylibium petroleiphilum (strain ATCC BAA-1232 / LMG 22953 / PM1) TaxID=420662 RepID=A2SHR5_METPP|nr:NADPH-dependent FMN reductase [Methylibium petroleiphilum]ABM95104.1 putative NADPH-dependent fmn reductase oxidoreductase protein [Methylibium petroleiphilum PM1]
MKVISILGSPSLRSRSGALLQLAQARLQPHATTTETITVRDLPGQALLHAEFADTDIQAAIRKVLEAQVVLVATPIYKAAYSGLLKSFLDLLPQDGLRDKTVLPLATGGSAAHLLALDYALKPVLSALGARDILDAVYASDAQIPSVDGRYEVDAEIGVRVEQSLRSVIERDAVLARARGTPQPPWLSHRVRWAV